MSDTAIHATMITLGVTDIENSAAFYEAMGLKRSSASQESVVFFDMGGLALGLFGREALADDADVPSHGEGFRGVAIAWNRPDEDEVDACIARMVEAGGVVTKPAEKVFWGGYSGYFADLDGHVWEVAMNPFWTINDDGTLTL